MTTNHANESQGGTCLRGPTKLLFVLAANVFGGAESQTHSLLTALCNSFEVTLLTHARIGRRFKGLPLTLIEFEAHGLNAPYQYDLRNVVRYAGAISHVAVQSDCDIVYAVMHNSSLFVAAARSLHPWSMRRCRVVGSLHGSFVACFEQRSSPPSIVESATIRSVIQILGAVVTPSQGVADELVNTFGARPQRVHPIYNGFDLEAIRESARQPLPVEKRELWVVTCCRLTEQKDFSTLITAFSRIALVSRAKLVIVGEGPERDNIENLASAYGLGGKVFLAGYQENPFPWIRSADVFVLSSHYEGFGNVIVEAFSLGTPVIASDCPWGPAEIIESGTNGFLFRPGDVSELVGHIDELLADAALREQMGCAAALRSEYFSRERMSEQYAELFKRIDHRL